MAKYSDILGGGFRSSTNYFEQIGRSAGLIPLNVFATVNNRFSLHESSPEMHASLEAEMLSDSIRTKLSRVRKSRAGEPTTVVFTRAGALLTLKLLLAVPRPETPYKATALGASALHANDFVESFDTTDLSSGLLPVVAEFAGTWELQNPREPGLLLRRSYYIYDCLLRQHEGIRALIERELHASIADVTFAGLPFGKFFPLLFGLHTAARNGIKRQLTSIVDGADVAAKAQISPEAFNTFAAAKARTIDEAKLTFGPIHNADEFRSRVENLAWTSDVRPFREKPLLLIPDGRYMVMDAQFLFENASAGLFWNFMHQLKESKARHLFSGYWGAVFERYTAELIGHYFPEVRTSVSYPGACADLLLES
ncbi:MAG TPA: hypothetical protein VI670_14290, partial [Thermoanaerobaculia bacterium]